MKLLFDENLSPRLAIDLSGLYPGSAHVHGVELGSAPDDDVWRYARDNGFVIVSKDSDFHERSLIYGHPPKVIWLRRGNCSTSSITSMLRNHLADVHALINDNQLAFLILY